MAVPTPLSLSSPSETVADNDDPTEVFLSAPNPPGKFSDVIGQVTLDTSVAAVNRPNTEVFGFTTMKNSDAGSIFLGDDDGNPVYQFVPNHTRINNFGAGASQSFAFTFRDDATPETPAVFTLKVTGVNDKPVVSTDILDITKGLPSSSFSCQIFDDPNGEPPRAAVASPANSPAPPQSSAVESCCSTTATLAPPLPLCTIPS